MLYLKTLTDKHSKEIYSQARILFNLREEVLKKVSTKGIIKNDSNQSGIEYEENIAERTKLRKQRLSEIKRKEQNINNDLFKKTLNTKVQVICTKNQMRQKTQKEIKLD